MCLNCNEMEKLVKKNKIDLKIIEELINNKSIELYAGNCFINEIDHYMEKGNHYTINTICRCNYCNEYYYIGFCLYGNPIIKVIDEDDVQKRASNLEWGYVGTHFANN